jgi:hypothetical protein
VICYLSFDIAQDGELVEPFEILLWDLSARRKASLTGAGGLL